MRRLKVVAPQSKNKKTASKSIGRKESQLLNPVINWPQPVSLNFKGIGFPDRYVTHLKYTQEIVFTGSATPSAQVFRMNSCFDPDLSGTGTQPTYFDQLSTIYGIYCVTGAEAKVEFLCPSATEGAYYVCTLSDQRIDSLSVEALCETKYEKHGQVSLSPANNRAICNIPYMSTSHIMGQSQIESDANMYATIGSNPNDQWFLTIKVAAIDGVTATTVNVRATLVYHVLFKDLTSPGES